MISITPIGQERFVEEGSFELSKVNEGPDRILEFDPPLEVCYFVYDQDELADAPPTIKRTAHIQYDFGMVDEFLIDNKNFFLTSYGGLNTDSSNEEKIRQCVIYDLFHAFLHFEGDPNYCHKHWALTGHLKNRTKATENEDITS
jgi:hypothetical protein